MNRQNSIAITCCIILMMIISSTLAKEKTVIAKDNMMRKSIVFDKNTPDVFYCPTQKPSGFDKLIVRSKPLHKLCEFEGKPLPEDYKSDCYQDVDETSYACKEKYRIMMRMYPPGSDAPYNGSRLKRFMDLDSDVIKQMLNQNENNL